MTDYQLFLTENGLTEESMQESLRKLDAEGLAGECLSVVLGESLIPSAGKGIFAKCPIDTGTVVEAIQLHGHKWTLAGRCTNHSNTPNSRASTGLGCAYLVATKNIAIGEEITADYRQVKRALEAAI